MSRLTEKREKPLTTKWEDVPTSYYRIKGDDTGVAISEIERLNKLGRLEDLEEQLGCPLEVMFKALKEGIYQADGGRRKYPTIEYNGATKKFYFTFGTYCNVEEYGKEWFLKEDRSE